MNFSLDNLDSVQTAYERLKRKVIELREQKHKGDDFSKEYEKQFLDAINDDLNMSKALDVFLRVLEDFDFSPKKRIKLLEDFDRVLGLGVKEMVQKSVRIPSEIRELVDSREKSRKSGDYAEADLLRERVREKGFEIEDSAKGPVIRKL